MNFVIFLNNCFFYRTLLLAASEMISNCKNEQTQWLQPEAATGRVLRKRCS